MRRVHEADTRKLYIVAHAATRVGVLAHSKDAAFRAFIADKFPIGEGGSRLAPPRADGLPRAPRH